MAHEDKIEDIVDFLNQGKVLLHPTDTIWGLGCDALNEDAIKRIYDIKNRPFSAPLIMLVADQNMLKEYVEEVHPKIEKILFYSNRPVTVLYKSKGNIPGVLVNPEGQIAVRIPQEPWLADIIQRFGRPLVSTSANIHGEPFPINFNDVDDRIKNAADYVAFHNRENLIPNEPSVVITINDKDDIVFLRE